MLLKKLLTESQLIMFSEVRGSRAFMPAGWKLRKNLYAWAARQLEEMGYDEMHLPDIISTDALACMSSICVPPDYFLLSKSDTYLAATHEASFFSTMKLLVPKLAMPVRLFNFGPAYRSPKGAKSPYNFGERNSFMEAYFMSKSATDSSAEFRRLADQMARFVTETLGLPSIFVRRPQYGNFSFAAETRSVETYLPEAGRTLCSAMAYDQRDMFTKAFRISTRRQLMYSAHAAFTDNLMYAYLENCRNDQGFWFHSGISPDHVAILVDNNSPGCRRFAERIVDMLSRAGLSGRTIPYDQQRQLKDLRRRLTLQGVPVVLALDPPRTREGRAVAICRSSPDTEITPEFSVPWVESILVEHDALLEKTLQASRVVAVVRARSLAEINSALDQGYIASSYLQQSEAAVDLVTRGLSRGEVLGFDLADDETGPCVLATGTRGHKCWFGRRV